MLLLKTNKFIKSVEVGIMGLAMLAASSLPALASSHPTQVSGSITIGGSPVVGANVTARCTHKTYISGRIGYSNVFVWGISDSSGRYYVNFSPDWCNVGDQVGVNASYGTATGNNYGTITLVNNLYMTYPGATLNISLSTPSTSSCPYCR